MSRSCHCPDAGAGDDDPRGLVVTLFPRAKGIKGVPKGVRGRDRSRPVTIDHRRNIATHSCPIITK